MADEDKVKDDESTKRMLKESAQKREANTRVKQESDYDRVDMFNQKRWRDLFFTRPGLPEMTFTALGNPAPEEDPNAQGNGHALLIDQNAVKGKLPDYDEYEVEIDKVKQPYKLQFTAKGIKPVPPSEEGYFAAVRFAILKGNVDAMGINCSAQPQLPKEAAIFLLRRATDVTQNGIAVTLEGNAKHFLNNTQDKDALKLKDLIFEIEKISLVGLGATRLNSAAVADANENWLAGDLQKLTTANTAVIPINGVNGPNPEMPAQKIQAINNLPDATADLQKELDDFTTRVQRLENAQSRLSELQNAEKWRIDDPESAIKAEQIKNLHTKGLDDKELIKKMEEIVNASVSVADMQPVLTDINTKNDVNATQRKTQLLTACETERAALVQIRDALDNKFTNANVANVPQADKDKLIKDLAKFDSVIGKGVVQSSLQTKNTEMTNWNNNGRTTAINQKTADLNQAAAPRIH